MNAKIKPVAKKRNSKPKGINLAKPHIIIFVVLVLTLLLTLNLVGKSQQYRQYAQSSVNNYCSGMVIATSPDFKSKKELACQFVSITADKVMESKAGCTSKAEAEAAIKEACKIENPPANGCVGEVVGSTPSFKVNKAAACGAFRTQLIDGLVANPDTGCASRVDAEKAVNDACSDTAPSVVPPTATPSPATESAGGGFVQIISNFFTQLFNVIK